MKKILNSKIDKRKSYYVVLDTETCPMDKTVQDVDAYNMMTYDVGFAVVDKKGNVYETHSYLVYEVFCLEQELMNSAYYANKIPMYKEQVKNGTRTIKRWSNIIKELKAVCEKYHVKAIIAHNARFDYTTLQVTQRWLTKSKYRYALPYGVEVWDSLKMVRTTIAKQKTYKEWCKRNSYMTKNGQVRMTAEIVYRYITGNNEFVESHTGLEDVLIEKEIFAHCVRQHKKMDKKLWKN